MSSVQRLVPDSLSAVCAARGDFPLFADGAAGSQLHYLDNAATTQKPRSVIDAVSRCYEVGYAPIHRGLYPLAAAATDSYEQARATLAGFVGAATANELVFTRSATEAINLVAEGWARPRLRPGDRIWVSRMEHHANYLPWQRVCQATGAELGIIELGADRQLDWTATPGLFDPTTRLIAVTQVSNVLGVVNPVAELCATARANGIPVLVDGAQAVGHTAVDVQALDCDFYAFSAHKMYGPAGIGLLYGRQERLVEMQPLLVGGGMVDVVGEGSAESLWAEAPACFEAGSPNLPGAVGFAAAADYMQALGAERVAQHVAALTRSAIDALRDVDGLRLLVPADAITAPVVSFTLKGLHPHDVAQIAGESQVAIRAGHHCAQPLLRSLGLAATARASFAVYNDDSDVDALVEAIGRARALFAGG